MKEASPKSTILCDLPPIRDRESSGNCSEVLEGDGGEIIFGENLRANSWKRFDWVWGYIS